MRAPIPSRPDVPTLVRAVAMVAVAAGIGIWAAILLAPAPQTPPPTLDTTATTPPDTTALAQWFGGALRVRVTALGVITSTDGHGAALLSVNGEPPRAYRVGQPLAAGVTLDAVGAKHITVAQDGLVEQVALPASTMPQGFITAGSP